MYDHSINLLEEIDSASKIHTLQRNDIDALMLEFAKRITATLKIERMSTWLFTKERDAIISMGEYDTRTQRLGKETRLDATDFPSYFKALNENKIILAPDMRKDPKTSEFNEKYSIPNDVVSLMDVPLRIMGELVGVMCFEKCGNELRHFSEKEQTFAFSLGLVFASNLEARHRRTIQHKMEHLIQEKDLLIKEINHRVKNNFTILISLLRLSKNQGKTRDINTLLDEYEHRIMSMLKIHDLLFQTENYVEIPLGRYIQELCTEFKNSHPEFKGNIHCDIKEVDFKMESKSSISLGLMITEIFLNSVKHAMLKDNTISFAVKLKQEDGKIVITAGNEGKGFNFNKHFKETTLGLHLIKDLAEDICSSFVFPDLNSSYYKFEIPNHG